MRNSSLKGILNAVSPMKQKEEKPTKPPKKRVNIKTGKHEMRTGTKTNPVTGKKTETYSAY